MLSFCNERDAEICFEVAREFSHVGENLAGNAWSGVLKARGVAERVGATEESWPGLAAKFARYACIDELRRTRPGSRLGIPPGSAHRPESLDEYADEIPAPEGSLDTKDPSVDYLALLDSCDDQLRACARLKWVDSWSYERIGSLFGHGPNWAKKRVSRAAALVALEVLDGP